MATKIIRVDDIDGSEAEVENIRLTVRGKNYALDLGPKNVAALMAALEPFTSVAHVTSTKTKRHSNSQEVRAWAIDNGVTVPARGRIPANVTEAWEEATKSGK